MTVFTVHPDGDGPYPIALLYMDGVGCREQVKENARRFAADGYYASSPTSSTAPARSSASTPPKWETPTSATG
jgi:dienelactone hydrolase